MSNLNIGGPHLATLGGGREANSSGNTLTEGTYLLPSFKRSIMSSPKFPGTANTMPMNDDQRSIEPKDFISGQYNTQSNVQRNVSDFAETQEFSLDQANNASLKSPKDITSSKKDRHALKVKKIQTVSTIPINQKRRKTIEVNGSLNTVSKASE